VISRHVARLIKPSHAGMEARKEKELPQQPQVIHLVQHMMKVRAPVRRLQKQAM